MCRHSRAFLVFNLALFLSISAVADSGYRKLTQAEARQLATMALPRFARELPDLRLDANNGYPGVSGFYWFEATASVPDQTSPILGHFAVNQTTGDVWDPVSCRKVTSPDLRNLQARMRKRIGLADRDLAHLSKLAPCEP